MSAAAASAARSVGAGRATAGALLTVLLLLGNVVVANVIVSRHGAMRFDLTEAKENTLAPGTLRTVSSLPDRARVRAFVSKDLPPEAVPILEPALDILQQLERVSRGRVVVDYLDPSRAEVALEAQKLGIAPVQGQVWRGDRREQVPIYFGLEIRCADRPTKVIPFLDTRNAEYEIARALKAVSDERPPVVAFLSREPPEPPSIPGFEMPAPEGRDFQLLRDRLKDRYKVRDLALTKYGEAIPEDVAVLVLPRPEKLDERERFEIDQFVMRGGRLLVLAERHRYRDPSQHEPIETGLDPLLQKWGVRIVPDALVVDGSHLQIQVPRRGPRGTQQVVVGYPYFAVLSRATGAFSANHPITKYLESLELFWAGAIEVLPDRPATVEVENLLQSSEASYLTRAVEDVSPDEELDRRIVTKLVSRTPARQRIAVALVGKFASAFAGAPVPPIAADLPPNADAPKLDDAARGTLAESRETRIVVVADSDVAGNDSLRRSPAAGIFLGNAVDWLALDQDLISIRSRGQARRIRDLETEAMKDLGLDVSDGSLSVAMEDLPKLLQDRERIRLEARDAADSVRRRIKIAAVCGPGVLLLALALLRLLARGAERRRAAAVAARAAA